MSDSVLETQLPDESSRKELQRLKKILSGGKLRLLMAHLSLPLGLILLTMLVAPIRWALSGYYFPFALIHVVGSIVQIYYLWPRYVARADAIRAGASFAAPANLKDHYIFLLSAVFLGLLSGTLENESLLSPSEFTRVGSMILFISANVCALWALGKAIVGYRVCPPDHLRRRDYLNGIFASLLLLLLLCVGAAAVTSLPVLIECLYT